jgi:dihydroneopterin aldolase
MLNTAGDKIILRDLRFWGCHGVYAEEKLKPQEFAVHITLSLNAAAAALSDNIKDTVDYTGLYFKIKTLTEKKSFSLMETLAFNILKEIFLYSPQITAARVGVSKLRAKAGEDLIKPLIVMERKREEVMI